MNFTQSGNHKLISIYPITFLVYFKVSYNFSICLEYRILCNIKMTPGNNNVTAFNRYDNDSNTFLLFKPKILNAIKFIRDRKNVLIWKLYLTI